MQILKREFKAIITALNSIKSTPINSLSHILPMIMMFTSLIGFFVAIILFSVTGGFSTQLNVISENWINNVKNAFTYGTVNVLTSGIVSKIVLMIFLIELILLTILFYRTASKVRKTLATICLSMTVVSFGLFFIINGVVINNPNFSNRDIYEFFCNTNSMQSISVVQIILLMAFLTILLYLVFIYVSEYRTVVNKALFSLLFSFVAMPLILLLIENIIPLFLGIIALALLGGIIFCICRVIWASFESAANSSNSNSSSKQKSNAKENKPKATTPKEEKNCAYIPQYNELLGNKLWKIKGMFHDYIANDNGFNTSEICSLEDFRKGKFKIYDKKTGRQIKDSEIKWKN